jgi:hypothetical protein
MTKYLLAVCLLIFVSLGGCQMYQPDLPDVNGVYPTTSVFKSSDTIISQHVDLNKYHIIYVKDYGFNVHEPAFSGTSLSREKFWAKSIAQLGLFKHIYILSTTDKLSGYAARDALFVKISTDCRYDCTVWFSVSSSQEGRLLFEAKKKWPLFKHFKRAALNPILNAFSRWVKLNKLRVESSS